MLIWAHNQWVFRHEAIKLNDVDIMHGVAKWRSSWDDLLNSTIFSTHYKAWHKICHLKTFIYILWPNVHSDIFLWVSLTLTYWCQDNVAAIFFLYENCGILDKIHLNLYPMVQLTIWQWVIIGSDGGLVLIRRQAIMLTNDGPVYWRILYVTQPSLFN